METRIVVGDAASASAVAERLVVAFEADWVTLRGDHPEVGIRVEGESSDGLTTPACGRPSASA